METVTRQCRAANSGDRVTVQLRVIKKFKNFMKAGSGFCASRKIKNSQSSGGRLLLRMSCCGITSHCVVYSIMVMRFKSMPGSRSHAAEAGNTPVITGGATEGSAGIWRAASCFFRAIPDSSCIQRHQPGENSVGSTVRQLLHI